MTTNRREFIARTGATLAVLSNLAACAKPAPGANAVDVEAMLSLVAEDLLTDYPENATTYGIDSGERAALESRLSDRSAAG